MKCEYGYCRKEATKDFFDLQHHFVLYHYCNMHCMEVKEHWEKHNYPKVIKDIEIETNT